MPATPAPIATAQRAGAGLVSGHCWQQEQPEPRPVVSGRGLGAASPRCQARADPQVQLHTCGSSGRGAEGTLRRRSAMYVSASNSGRVKASG